MPTEQPKRLKTIKVRVTESELASLRAACPKAQLAEWMREHCLGVVPQQRRTPPPTIDPALLRQVAGIGNNLNQIARRINASPLTTLDKVEYLAALAAIGRELEGLRRDRQNP
jgi:hypothetical protein